MATTWTASWYGPGFEGNPTANGERFDPNGLTAAHKTLPFGTRLRVTNRRTGKSVTVVVNDRGPFIAGRDLDLSAGAARAIGIDSQGVGRVEVQVLPKGPRDLRGSGADLTPERGGTPRRAGIVNILPTPLPSASGFLTPDGPEGVPGGPGGYVHGGLDWFAPGGTVVRSPVAGRVVRVSPSRGNSGQVFGGVVQIRAGDGKVFTLRHVDPSVAVGARVLPGSQVAKVTPWTGGSPHAHVEVWKTLGGGYTFANMLDPKSVFEGAGASVAPGQDPEVADWSRPPGEEGECEPLQAGPISIPNVACMVIEFVKEKAVTAFFFLAIGAIGVWLVGQGSSRAFGTPAPGQVARAAAARTPIGAAVGA